ncbi:hypothetical protein G6F65_022111 [Rhizopus arrhizus]|nr:hypothetical protein G6F65_022111 [Rhizopus arrhizus]
MAGGGGHVLGIMREVADQLVDAVHAQRAEVVAQGAQVAPGVGVQALVDVALHYLALGLQHVAPQAQERIQARHQLRLVALAGVAQAGAIDGDHAYRSGLLRRAEQAVAALEQFAQVQLQAAAHGPHHMGWEWGR